MTDEAVNKYGLSITMVPRDLYYVERQLVADQAAEIIRLREALRAAVAGEKERCLLKVAEQRCERGTPWDAALVAAMEAIRGEKP
jgi:hypothetical protein